MNPLIVQREFTIRNRQGLHARPAAMLVKLCNTFQSEIWVEKGDEQVNGKSIMGLMMLAANHGAVIKVTAEGTDAEAAVEKIGSLIESGFMEE
ncbi:MAG: HPr family phosphocarrier protein [Verrucomicrobiales bacterium]